jgi:hypothetical protein
MFSRIRIGSPAFFLILPQRIAQARSKIVARHEIIVWEGIIMQSILMQSIFSLAGAATVGVGGKET